MPNSLQTRREQIIKLRNSAVYRDLNMYYCKKSFFNILNIARKETVHSDFLTWLFNPKSHHSLDTLPLERLLETISIIYNRYQRNGRARFPVHLEDIIASGNYTVSNVKIEREKNIKVGAIDIAIGLVINYENKSEIINIIIENKVKSKESDSQTLRYFEWCEGNLEGSNIYVFLTPLSNSEFEKLMEPQCLCKYYIQLNYQYIVDYIIEPCKQRTIAEDAVVFIDEYLRTLSFPALQFDINEKDRGEIIMAISERERELLRNFWNANQELLIATLTALIDDPELPDEERADLSSGLNAIINASSKDYTKYAFNGETYPKNRLVMAVVNSYVEKHPNITYTELEEAFPHDLQGNKRTRVFAEVDKAQQIIDEGGGRRHFLNDDEIIYLNDCKIAVCNQWGKLNVTRFIDRARQLGFIIEEAR